MLLLSLRHLLELLLGLEVQLPDVQRHDQTQDDLLPQNKCFPSSNLFVPGTHLEVGVLASAETTHPKVRQDNLTARMGEEGPVVGSDGQGETALVRPRVQLAGEQALSLLRILSVAEVQQFVA